MNSGPHSARSTGANRQRSSLSRRPTSSTPIGISVPPAHSSLHEADQAAGLHRLEPEHDDVGEADVGREADRVRVAGDAAGRSSDRAATGSMAKPSVSIIQSIFSACGMWKSGSSTSTTVPRYRLRRLHVPVPAVSQVAGVPPPRHRRDRDDGEPRVLAAAPARRAPGRATPRWRAGSTCRRRRSTTCSPTGADPDDAAVAAGDGRRAGTCPTSSSSSSTAPRTASPARSS